MTICSGRSFAVSLLAGALVSISTAYAGPTDTPLPTFSDGKPAVAVYTAVGVIKGSNLETDFVCTNVDAVAVDIGLEVFDETGALRNSVHAGSGAFLNVGPGKTVTVGTAATVVFHEDQTLTLNTAGNGTAALSNGSGRVVGTSKNVLCTALLADKRGLVLGVSSRDGVGFHAAEQLRGHDAEVAVSLRPNRGAFMSELAAAGYTTQDN